MSRTADRPSWCAAARVVAAVAALAIPARARAVTRSCGADASANTASVLCAPSSGPCNGATVTVSENIDVTAGGCTFDAGGRAVVFQRTLNMIGSGFIVVENAGDVTITTTGKLKARGDFVTPNGYILRGGLIAITSDGTITNQGVIDVSGDSAGTVELTAHGDVTLANNSSLTGNGVTVASEGERYADGGTVEITALTGSITVTAPIDLLGTNQATGGTADLQAARDIVVNQAITLTGGGGDGGEADLDAGDHVTVNRTIDCSSLVGGGYGGSISIAAGDDFLGGVVAGGNAVVNGPATLKLNGSDTDTTAGDGGDVDVSAAGDVRFVGSGVAIRANAPNGFDGSGGSISLDSGDADPNRIGPTDGDVVVEGTIVARSSGLGGDGGSFEASAGKDLTIKATIDVSGTDGGGDVSGESGGATSLTGTITAAALSAGGDPGFVDFAAGLARNAGLTVSQNVLAPGGSGNGGSQSISLAGCLLTVNNGVKVDGHGGVAGTTAGGSSVELISRQPMQLKASSQFLAYGGGTIRTVHPPGQAPVIGNGVVFNPARIDSALADGPYPSCPVCGDGTVQAGEACEPALDACCNATCTGFVCVTATPTPTLTPMRTPTPTRTATTAHTPTPTATSGAAETPSAGATATATASVAPTSGATEVATATATPAPTATPTVTPVPTATAAAGVVDHYKCYASKTKPGSPGFVRRDVTLADPFETTAATVLETEELCNPVDANGAGIADPSARLVCYKIRETHGQGAFASRDVAIENEFGPQRVKARSPRSLCVPAAIGAPSLPSLDRFKCYDARKPAGEPVFARRQLLLADAFESKLTRVVKPLRFCTAVDANGEGLMHHGAELHCYKIADASGQSKFVRRDVGTADEFGLETLTVQKPTVVCVPSTRDVPAVCGDGYRDLGEQCDDGNTRDGDGCDAACRLESCGDGVVNAGEECDDGAGNGTDDCCSAACERVDPDRDGICSRDDLCPADADNDSDHDGYCVADAFNPPALGGGDPCSRGPVGALDKPKLTLKKLDGGPRAQKLTLKTSFRIPSGGPPIAPDVYGVRLRLTDRAGAIVLDARIPGGRFGGTGSVGWKTDGTPPRRWQFVDAANEPPLYGGIKRLELDQAAGLVKVAVTAVAGTYAVAPGQEPLRVGIELDDGAEPPGGTPGIDRCGEMAFHAYPDRPACRFSGGPLSNRTLVCK